MKSFKSLSEAVKAAKLKTYQGGYIVIVPTFTIIEKEKAPKCSKAPFEAFLNGWFEPIGNLATLAARLRKIIPERKSPHLKGVGFNA